MDAVKMAVENLKAGNAQDPLTQMKPSERLSLIVRRLCASSSDSRLALAAEALADAYDETVKSFDEIDRLLKRGMR